MAAAGCRARRAHADPSDWQVSGISCHSVTEYEKVSLKLLTKRAAVVYHTKRGVITSPVSTTA